MSANALAAAPSGHLSTSKPANNPWIKFVQAVDPDFSDEFCQLLLRSLPELAKEARYPILGRIQLLVTAAAKHITANNQQMRSRALAVLTFALAHRVHTLVLDFVLNTLAEITEHTEYWESRAAVPGRFFFESGPARWWAEVPTFQQLRDSGFDLKVWLNSLRSRQNHHIATRLDALYELEARFVERAGHLHQHMFNLQHVPEVTADLEPCLTSTDELYRFITGQRHESLILSPPSRGRGPRGTNEATPELLLNVLLDTLEYLPKFEITVLEYLQRWRSPGHLQRNWFWYTLGSTVASYTCIKFLNNRQQIVANMQEARGIMSNFTYEHVLEPVMKIYHHVFKTLKNRQIETTSQQLGASRLHLSNMLRAYGIEHQDFPVKEVEAMAARGDMSIVMKRYEEEVQKPLRSIGSGGIVQALLIQIQKLKVDTETTMLAVDQLIEANEINFELAATIPALLVVFPVLNALYQFWRSKKIPMFEQKAFYQLRLLLRKIDKVLTNYSNNQTGGSLSATGAGYILLHSARIDSLSRGIINGPELRHLREDLADLNSPAYTVAQKRFVIDRMTRTLPLMATASKSLSL